MRGILVTLVFMGALGGAWAQNNPPAVDAGNDTTVRLGLNFSFADARASDPDGDPLTYAWTILSGPAGGATVNAPRALRSSVTFSLTGMYEFSIAAGDGALSASDTIAVTVEDPLPSLVFKPEEGETLHVGSTYEITYQINNPGTPVNIDLSTDNGISCTHINAGAVRYGVFSWAMEEAPSDSCFIEIRQYTAGNALYATSGRFSIVDPSGVRDSSAGGRSRSNGLRRTAQRLVIRGAATQGAPLLDVTGRRPTAHAPHAAGVIIK